MTETITITNFGGRLTRIPNGEMNSGFAKFTPSWGYDPFSKPMNLTWLETPVDITGPITDLIVAAKTRFELGASQQYVYAVGHQGNLYKMETNTISSPNVDSVVGIGSVTSGGRTYTFGASMEFFGTPESLYVGGDLGVNRIPASSLVGVLFGGGDATVGTTNNYVANRYRPLKPFIGELLFGNGPTFGAIGSTGTVVSSVIGLPIAGVNQNIYSEINPAFSPENNVQDIDISPDYNYAFITASGISNEQISNVSSDRQAASSSEGNIFKWNGTDATTTAGTSIPSYAVTALQTYLQNNYFFSNDSFGASLNDGINKVLTLPNNKSPFANATGVNGNFIFWIAPELNTTGNGLNASMYYFGSLDQENPPGLYRLMRYSSTLAAGFIYQSPLNILTNNKFSTVNNALNAIVTLGFGKHYFSVYDVNASTNSYKLLRFLVTPSGSGTAQSGVYETQTQLFSKRIGISQIRVYTEPTVVNNGFQIDVVGSDGTVVTNGTFTYSFTAGTDINTLQGSLERINFNPNMGTLYAVGIRITNTGSSNMTIKKIEIDYSEEGK